MMSKTNKRETEYTRRKFLAGSAIAGSGVLLGAGFITGCKESSEEVTPVEDLMREHGVLRRVLIAYEEISRRLAKGQETNPSITTDCAGIIRSFVEDYHERLEEEYVFSLFIQAKRETDLVQTLFDQHKAGRRLTERITQLAGAKTEAERTELVNSIESFIRMYRPHAAREDTVLFPDFKDLLSGHELKKLGNIFEKEEDKLFGKGGFRKMVDKVAAIEKELGIFELARFTPHQEAQIP